MIILFPLLLNILYHLQVHSTVCPTNVYDCSNNIQTQPIGNNPLTYSSFSLHGNTTHKSTREFLVDLGMVSNVGNDSLPPTTPYHDKVTLYTSIVGNPGTGDIWSINPLVTQSPNSGEYAAQGIELDFNNNNAHRGDADAGSGLGGSVSYGLSVTGAGAYRSTSAILVAGPGTHTIWNRGIVFANNCIRSSTFQDLGDPEKSIDIRGNPVFGVYQSSKQTKNYFAGSTEHSGNLKAYGGRHVVTSVGEEYEHVSSGNVILNAFGEAIVYLSLMKEEFMMKQVLEHVYTLTSIGSPPRDLHVSKEIDDEGKFTIAGGTPKCKVSWTVRSQVANQ